MPFKDKQRQRDYQKKWIAARREKWLKENGPCVQCASNEDLQIDHKDRSQKLSHKVWSWSEERRNEELAKCQILCAECHKKKTYGQDFECYVHGTQDMYSHRGCRCEPCTSAHRESIRKWRALKKRVA